MLTVSVASLHIRAEQTIPMPTETDCRERQCESHSLKAAGLVLLETEPLPASAVCSSSSLPLACGGSHSLCKPPQKCSSDTECDHGPDQNCSVSYLLVGGVGVLQDCARGLQDPTLPLPPHWLPKAPVTSLPLRKVCSGVKQKAATLPPRFCSQSGAPHSQPPGHPKKPLQAARSPEAPLSHPHSPRGNSLAHLPLPMNSHLSRQHEGSGPGVWKPQGGPEHRRGSALLSGETASSPCTSVPPGPDETREASSCPGGGSHPLLFAAICLPLRTHFQAGCVIGRSLWGVEGGAQGPQGFSPHFSGSPSLLRLSLSCAHGCRDRPEGPDCGAQIPGEPCAVGVGAPGTVAALRSALFAKPRGPALNLWSTSQTTQG